MTAMKYPALTDEELLRRGREKIQQAETDIRKARRRIAVARKQVSVAIVKIRELRCLLQIDDRRPDA